MFGTSVLPVEWVFLPIELDTKWALSIWKFVFSSSGKFSWKFHWFFSLFWSLLDFSDLNIGHDGLVLIFLFSLLCLYVLFPRIPQLYLSTLLLSFGFFFFFHFPCVFNLPRLLSSECFLFLAFCYFMDIICFSEYGLHFLIFFFCFYFEPCRVKWLALDWWVFFFFRVLKDQKADWKLSTPRAGVLSFTKGVSSWGVFLLSWSVSQRGVYWAPSWEPSGRRWSGEMGLSF